MTARFAYDEVPYDTEANSEAHPRAMATLARLFGIDAAAPSTARVLEIGCGDGEHMIAAASYLPRARFVGFDLAADAVARGIEIARQAGADNVALLHRDVRDVRASGLEAPNARPFDYVVAHGVYSWVPEAIRGDVLAVIRDALAPTGVAFLSVNASPGWELRRALRVLMREAAADAEDPAERVRLALGLVDELATSKGDGFVRVLARAAGEYRAHVVQATPPDVPFSRYVFHDLLAECNDPFSATELAARLRHAGLRIVCETPLARARAQPSSAWDLSAEMATSGTPFLQVLVCRDDATVADVPALDTIRAMHLWADLAPAGAGTYRTTAGAMLRAAGDTPLARAARSAPGFVAVSTLADGEGELSDLERDLFVAFCHGLLAIASEPAAIGGVTSAPRVAPHVRLHARAAAARGAKSAVLTSALHRSFRVPRAELAVVAELDGTTEAATIAARLAPHHGAGARKHVEKVLDRFARYGFLLAEEGAGA